MGCEGSPEPVKKKGDLELGMGQKMNGAKDRNPRWSFSNAVNTREGKGLFRVVR